MKSKIKWTAIFGGIALVVLVIVIVLANVMYANPAQMGLMFGSAPVTTTKSDKAAGLDTTYYEWSTKNADESRVYARETTRTIVSEGAVLLENKAHGDAKSLPLGKNKTITLFGYDSYHPNMSGGEDPRGQRTEANEATVEGKEIYKPGAYCFDHAFETIGYTLNSDVHTALSAASAELSLDTYKSFDASYASSDAAVMVIKRNSGEGSDQTMDVGAAAGNRTGLSLSAAELDLLEYACTKIDNVIVVINAANVMELGFLQDGANYTDPYTKKTYDFSNVKGAIWCGGLGSYGALAVADIIAGNVNPSGHLVDIYTRSHKDDPTFVNFGDFKYSNSKDAGSYSTNSYFVEYEEGIYVGYRYYETAAYENSKNNYAGFDYNKSVTYPFGYGLSYTSFDMAYDSTPTFDEESNQFTFKVKVTNTGAVAGKQVAQIYVNVPYTSGGVEKAHVTLAGFAKTKVLEPNESVTVTITVDRDYIASYDYRTEKCYILDAGKYNFYLSENSHSWADITDAKTWTYSLEKKIIYKDGKDGKRKSDLITAVNVFDEELNWKFKDTKTAGYSTIFTRKDFAGTFPTAPAGDDYVADAYVLSELKVYNTFAESENPITVMPATNQEVVLQFSDMRGIAFDSPAWDTYIQQLTGDELESISCKGAWQTGSAIERVGIPLSYDADGPYGFFAHSLGTLKVNRWYQSAPVLAATYNVDLAKQKGDAIAEEAHNQEKWITGWYGPGLNGHRSPFGGRNYEYYSEDPVLAGKMAAAECTAASEKGLITYTKHYALNEQETNRQNNGYCAWADEQTFREIYNRGYEIYIKEAKMDVKYYEYNEENDSYTMKTKEMSGATGIMTAYNRIGAVYAGAGDAVSILLKKEAGFTGISLTDAGGEPNTYMNSDKGIKTGSTDLTLATSSVYDKTSATAITALQKSAKTVLYNKVNSNAYQKYELVPGTIIHIGTAGWEIMVIVMWIVAGVIAAAAAALIVLVWLGKILKAKD